MIHSIILAFALSLCKMKTKNTVILFLSLLLAFSCTKKQQPVGPTPEHGEFANEEVTVNNAKRVYRLVVPESVDLNSEAPLVVAFHGLGIDSKDLMPQYTLLNQTAQKNKFILVYPQAVGGSWALDAKKITDDIDFYDKLIEAVSSKFKISSNRIYVLGMSNGGYFAHMIAKERSEKITAAASHSGPLGLQTLLGIGAKRKFPVMILHGDKDQLFDISIAEENRDKYKKESHDVKYMRLNNVAHEWGTKYNVNDSIWTFFNRFSL
jgi:polyhydroxybutyrate depolymerase